MIALNESRPAVAFGFDATPDTTARYSGEMGKQGAIMDRDEYKAFPSIFTPQQIAYAHGMAGDLELAPEDNRQPMTERERVLERLSRK